MRFRHFLPGLLLVCGVAPGRAAEAGAVLWTAPGEITIRDWTWGPGGPDRAPKPPFEFIEEDSNGTNAKVKVRDAKGNRWVVKFGSENHSEVFASRLLFALGYLAQPNYFVASGVITGAHDLHRAKPFIGKDGSFAYARFKLSDHKALTQAEGQTWSWTENPFVGKQELNGLKIVLMLVSNWDGKDSRDGAGSNTAVYAKAGSGEKLYAFDDWGATMGRWGGFFKRDKWNVAGYQQQSRNFVRATSGETIEWGYRGKHGKDITTGISAADVRWLMTYLSRVTDEQLKAGLRASGATGPEVEAYARSLRDRIGQLERLSAPAAPVTVGAAGAPISSGNSR